MLVLGSDGQVVENAVIIMDYRGFTIDIDIDNNQTTIHNPDGDVTMKLTGLRHMPVVVLSIITATEVIDTWHNRPTADELLRGVLEDFNKMPSMMSTHPDILPIRNRVKDFLDN